MTSEAELIARATERAAADVRRGIAELERLVPTTAEWSHDDDASGKRLVVPKRAMLAGMLAHLKRHQP